MDLALGRSPGPFDSGGLVMTGARLPGSSAGFVVSSGVAVSSGVGKNPTLTFVVSDLTTTPGGTFLSLLFWIVLSSLMTGFFVGELMCAGSR